MSVADKIGFGPKREYVTIEGGSAVMVTVTPNPTFIRNPVSRTVRLSAEQFERMQDWLHGGVMIQDALPDLSARDREILMNGLAD